MNLPRVLDRLAVLGEEPKVAPMRGGKVSPVPVRELSWPRAAGWLILTGLILVGAAITSLIFPNSASFIYAAF